MKWIRQNDPEYLPGWVCEQCGSLVVQADSDAPPPQECKACGAGGDNPSDLATLGHLPLHKGGTPPMAAKERLKMPASQFMTGNAPVNVKRWLETEVDFE